MKRLLIRDGDGDLFDVPLRPILYNYYKENSKEIRRMVKKQVKVDLLVQGGSNMTGTDFFFVTIIARHSSDSQTGLNRF